MPKKVWNKRTSNLAENTTVKYVRAAAWLEVFICFSWGFFLCYCRSYCFAMASIAFGLFFHALLDGIAEIIELLERNAIQQQKHS